MAISLTERLADALGPRYRLLGELGRGGMGVVYLAADLELQREVAVKLLPPDLAADPARRERFKREARMAAGLSHPNIVPIHDVAERGDLVWFTMQYVEGESLRARVERTGRQRAGFAARVIQEVGYALAYAHARGIVHRDIKPDNILVERATGRALVTDFGIAKAMAPEGGGGSLTAEGMTPGTTAYMSPEQAAAERDVDGRSDLYSLGLVGHYLLTGRDVHAGPNPQAVLARVLTTRVPAVRDQRPDVPAWLDAALLGCTATDLDQRYQSAERLLEQIALGGSPPEVHPGARKVVRLAGVYGVISVGLAYTWAFAGGPLDPLFAFYGGAAACVVLLETVGRATRRGVGWKELRDALVDARRQLAEEKQWELAARRPGAVRSRVMLVFAGIATGALVVALGVTHREGPPPGELNSILQSLALLYGTSAALVLGWFLRLPRGDDAIEDWQPPRWLEWLGRILFRPWGRRPARPIGGTPSTTGTHRLVDRVIGLHQDLGQGPTDP